MKSSDISILYLNYRSLKHNRQVFLLQKLHHQTSSASSEATPQFGQNAIGCMTNGQFSLVYKTRA